jgi:hypothetical protein
MNLRALAESDLQYTIEGEYGMRVSLTAPDGTLINKDKNGNPLMARITYCQPRMDSNTGMMTIVDNPVVTLRRSSLTRIPATGENWKIVIPAGPREDAASVTYLLDSSRPSGQGKNLGIIRLYLIEVEQSAIEETTE